MELTKLEKETLTDQLADWIRGHMDAIGAQQAVLGISGGKDSSVVAALCVYALGADRVTGIIMPDGAQDDIAFAEDLCSHLGIQCATVNLRSLTDAFWDLIESTNLVGEISRQSRLNLPPRVRMSMLYAIAQSLNGVVVNTSNLSEDWVGYATVYGDTTGAFSPLATFTTDEVVQLGVHLSLPAHLVHKPPSDGLTGQTDEDIMGFSYDVLNTYIRTGEIDDPALKERIDHLHRISRFKFQVIPMFHNGLPIVAEDVAKVYAQ